MKRCPTCQKTFADSMRFCQIDGTPLVDETENAPAADPFKTVVASQDEGSSSVPPDENKTVIDGAPIREEKDYLPKGSDSAEAIIASGSSEGFASEEEPEINDPFSSESPKFDLNPTSNSTSSQSPFDAPTPSYQPPFKEPQQNFGETNAPFNQNPFEQSQNQFGEQPMQQSQCTPPPSPEASWQNQSIGANTTFQPSIAGQGQDKTLAIVSLVCGILSLTCCGPVTGIAAIITGFMAKNNVDANPQQYDGRGMAIAGMIMGAISFVLTVLYFIFVGFVGFFGR
jgi:hypothetical protein